MRSVKTNDSNCRRRLRAGCNKGHALGGCADRGPIRRLPRSKRQRSRVIDSHAEKMTAIIIAGRGAGIGIVNHESAVAAFGNMLDHVGTGRQQHRRAAGSRHRIQMRPVVQVRHEDDAITRRPVQIGPPRNVGEGTCERVGAGPDGVTDAIGCRGRPD